MKIFSTKFHGFLDYLVGIVLLAMPAILDLDTANTESLVFFASGGLLLFYSILTKYEFGLIRVLPMAAHLALDVLSGIFLAASPWLFGFGDRIFIPYLILGVTEIIAGLTTTTKLGVPEIQEVVPTTVIEHEIVRESAMNAPAGRSRAKSEPKHSIVEAKKTTPSKKTAAANTNKTTEKKPVAPGKKESAAAKKTLAAPPKAKQKTNAKK